jgi:polyferredoxin
LSGEPVRITGPSKARRVIQIVLLAFFLFLFTFTLFPLRERLPPVDILLRIDPVAALSSLVATRTAVYRMLFAIPLVVLTLIIGRFFCGYICPTGTCIDLWRRHVLKRDHDGLRGKDFGKWKYYVLILMMTSAVFGFSMVWLLDPLSIFTRFLTLTIHPVVAFLSDGALSLFAPLADKLGLTSVATKSVFRPSYQDGLSILLIFGGILALELAQRRFWCRNLCPLGGFLAIFSRFALFRRNVSVDCTGCGECEEACPMDAVHEEGKKVQAGECIGCYTCAAACPTEQVSIQIGRPRGPFKIDLERRKVLGSLGLGLLSMSVFNMDVLKVRKKHNFLRPPASVPEDVFLSRCYRCGECMKVCVTGGLQPSVLDAGLSGLWTPVLVPRIGGCEKTCNMCGQLCPSGAIRPLDPVEKTFVRIGTASIDKSRCIAWEQQKLCLICDEICPFGAIDFKLVSDPEGESKKPFVNEKVCTGCGLCEQKCPVEGNSAIQVSPMGEERLLAGAYMTTEKIVLRRNAIEGKTGLEQLKEEEKSPKREESLPKGFIIEK